MTGRPPNYPPPAKKLPPQISRDMKMVHKPLLMTFFPMDGLFGLVGIVVMCLSLVVVPLAAYHSSLQHQIPMRRDDFIAVGGAELMLVAGLVVVVVKRGAQRRLRRFAAGQCIHCGYNLIATPDRCPECGNKPYPG